MFIYLDESYNLKDRTKPQFISINGFAVLNVKTLFKQWKQYRRPFIGGRRIHASDPTFDRLRPKALKLIKRHDLILLTVFQIIQEIPFQKERSYFYKNKLDFDKVYLQLLKAMFKELSLEEYRCVTIIIDSRKHKTGVLGQKKFINSVEKFLKKTYSKIKFEFKMQSSSMDILLELADFISNIFYRKYVQNDQGFFEDLKFKLIQIKNPLK